MNDSDLHSASQTLRIFVAAALPKQTVRELANVQQHLENVCARQRIKLRLTPAHQFHLTLAFLGNIRQELLESVFEVVRTTAGSFPECELRPIGLRALPTASRARVIAMSFEERSERLASLVAALHAGLQECGCECERRAFLAHVTIVRLPVPRYIPNIEVLDEVSAVRLREVTVFQSVLKATGAEHRRLFSCQLGSAPSVR